MITLLKELRAFTLKEEGNISYDTYRGEDPDFDLLLHEQYVTSAALELHRQSIYFNNLFSEKILPHLESRTVIVWDEEK